MISQSLRIVLSVVAILLFLTADSSAEPKDDEGDIIVTATRRAEPWFELPSAARSIDDPEAKVEVSDGDVLRAGKRRFARLRV